MAEDCRLYMMAISPIDEEGLRRLHTALVHLFLTLFMRCRRHEQRVRFWEERETLWLQEVQHKRKQQRCGGNNVCVCVKGVGGRVGTKAALDHAQ